MVLFDPDTSNSYDLKTHGIFPFSRFKSSNNLYFLNDIECFSIGCVDLKLKDRVFERKMERKALKCH